MKYYSIDGKAVIKIDDSTSLENIKKKAIDLKLVSAKDKIVVKEISQDDFLAPIEFVSFQDIVDEMRLNSVGADKKHRNKRKKK